MKRRDFSVACGCALAAGAWVVPVVQAKTAPASTTQEKKPQAGEDYQVLDKRASVDAPSGKIEIVEFFGTTALTATLSSLCWMLGLNACPKMSC